MTGHHFSRMPVEIIKTVLYLDIDIFRTVFWFSFYHAVERKHHAFNKYISNYFGIAKAFMVICFYPFSKFWSLYFIDKRCGHMIMENVFTYAYIF